MASAAEIELAARNRESQLKKELEDRLSASSNQAYNSAQNVAQLGTQSALAELENKLKGYQANYQSNAQQAYTQSMLGKQTLQDQLNRMGLNTTGFGAGQILGVENQYSQNLSNLQKGLASDTANIDLSKTQAQLSLQQQLSNLAAKKAESDISMNQYINEQGQNAYQTEYDRLFREQQYQDQLKQQEYERQMAEKQYADQLAQQAFENSLMSSSGGSSGGSSGITGGAASKVEVNPVSATEFPGLVNYGSVTKISNGNNNNTKYYTSDGKIHEIASQINPYNGKTNKDVLSNGKFDSSKAMAGNPYQPNNYKGKPLKAVGKVKDTIGTGIPNGFGVDISGQNVYTVTNKDKTLTYLVWDGYSNAYQDVTKLVKDREKEEFKKKVSNVGKIAYNAVKNTPQAKVVNTVSKKVGSMISKIIDNGKKKK